MPHIEKVIHLDGGNLVAWQTYFWLSVVTKNEDKVRAALAHLYQRLPTTSETQEQEMKCREFTA